MLKLFVVFLLILLIVLLLVLELILLVTIFSVRALPAVLEVLLVLVLILLRHFNSPLSTPLVWRKAGTIMQKDSAGIFCQAALCPQPWETPLAEHLIGAHRHGIGEIQRTGRLVIQHRQTHAVVRVIP